MPKITPCLWFDDQAEEAAELYTSLFPNSRIVDVTRYGDAGPGEPGKVMVVKFELDGQEFVGLNGGPLFSFTEAVSFQIDCADQAEVDHYWDGLLAGGGEESMCGWLKDRFGLSWQVTPRRMIELISDPDPERAARAMTVMQTMRKLDADAAERYVNGAGDAAEEAPAGVG